ncbi:MAG: hypothetical protein NDJ65_04085 [Paludibacteraceae bacterium]|nr:hypothetical protein [Paludibacteraceae bacterium]
MKAYLIVGAEGAGKTTLLNDYFNVLLNRGVVSNKLVSLDGSDFYCELSYRNKKVLINTQGDTVKHLNFIFSKYHNFDVLVTAVRDSKLQAKTFKPNGIISILNMPQTVVDLNRNIII